MDSAAAGAIQGFAPATGAVYSLSARMGLKIGLRAQGTCVQEAGPGLRPLAPPFTNGNAAFQWRAAFVSVARLTIATAAAAVLLLFTLHNVTAEPLNEASSVSATPTYVSELGPAVSIGPREAGVLPAAGSGREGGGGPSFPGMALAAGGVALIYFGRSIRPRPAS